MTNITWPDSLPLTLQLENLSAQKKSNVVRTTMDAGPQKARRRYTVQSKIFTGTMILTETQRRIFESWYEDTLGSGVLRFVFTDPQTLVPGEFRFTEDYKEESVSGLWKITLSLEKLDA